MSQPTPPGSITRTEASRTPTPTPARIETSVPTTPSTTVSGLVSPTPSANVAAPPPGTAGRPRRIALTPLSAWSQPGLCATSDEADATREKLTKSFRYVDHQAIAQLYLDPRLPTDAEAGVLPLLEQAETEVKRRLGLQPPPPTIYVYSDTQLMKAAACINEDVVAFYDGALHLVVNRPDLQESVTHELTHHALFKSGLIGPAWAQEGIAMLVAREAWWRDPARLQALLREPFAPTQMEELIPYKLSSEQAVTFYVQAALSVDCLLARRRWSLQQLADTLRAGSDPSSVSYDLPELRDGAFLRDCVLAQGRP